MKILWVISGTDFKDHPRKSTVFAIYRLHNETNVLLLNSIRNRFTAKNLSPGIRYLFHYFWIVEKLRKFKFLCELEHFIRKYRWRNIFRNYSHVIMIDPNQHYLLPYLSDHHKLVYLLRDPVVLQNSGNRYGEKKITDRSDIILAISENLRDKYYPDNYGFQPSKIELWTNAVDLEVWNYNFYKPKEFTDGKVILGMAGNINERTDLALLELLLKNHPVIIFEICGKLKLTLKESIDHWNNLLKFQNLKWLGFIPFNELPGRVAGWTAGLLLEKMNIGYSVYYNHNKLYQYLALGMGFISYRYNKSFDRFNDVAWLATGPEEYALQVTRVLIEKEEESKVIKRREIASQHSSELRAREFISLMEKLV